MVNFYVSGGFDIAAANNSSASLSRSAAAS